ncbi:HutD/Ves family protein [Achromobacter pestifer]|uniref:Protein Ves n=1 Tax=Achromobacter pestifer TaxID=1353889 RepID=A0A6S6YQB0_9BURK|nr:HutD family protein [Achromobacter pestifer]CAB3631328.1 Protein Ves [Achromobacter pestifer]
MHLTLADWQALPAEPWKNGGGVTRTVARDADAAAARWRVSIADIARDGPYSRFPGYDRVSVVLTGQGVALHGAGMEVVLLPGVATTFPGDIAFQSRLLGEPVQVLNVFVRRDAARVTVSCVGLTQIAVIAGRLADGAEALQQFHWTVDVHAGPPRQDGVDAVLLDLQVAACRAA